MVQINVDIDDIRKLRARKRNPDDYKDITRENMNRTVRIKLLTILSAASGN